MRRSAVPSTPADPTAYNLPDGRFRATFEGTGELLADVRELVDRLTLTHSRIHPGDLLPDVRTGLNELGLNELGLNELALSEEDVVDAVATARSAHRELLRDAARWFTTTYGVDGRLLVDMVEGTFLYRGLLGTSDPRELAERIVRLLCPPAPPPDDDREPL